MRQLSILLVLSVALVLGGCATSTPQGRLFTGMDLPVTATSNGEASKVGKASCQSLLFLFASGDCSLQAAKEDGGISKVAHADWSATNILGLYGRYELTVHGE